MRKFYSGGLLLLLLTRIFLLNFLNFTVATPSTSTVQKSEESSTIHQLLPEQQGVLSERNTTFSLLWSNLQDTLIVELVIATTLDTQNSIVFGISQNHALFLNSESSTYNGDFIDSRGYFMHKSHYRIQFSPENSDDSSNGTNTADKIQLFVTIFQNGGPVQELQYAMRMKVQSASSLEKLCPFNCLKRGTCLTEHGYCMCDSGYVDYDCSKPSTNLDQFRHAKLNSEQEQSLDWKIDFQPIDARFYFYSDSSAFNQYLVLQINQTSNSQDIKTNNSVLSHCGNVEVYYTPETKELQGLGVADRHFFKTAKLITESELSSGNNIEILLDKFESPSQESERQLLFGFRHTGQSSCQLSAKVFWTTNYDTGDTNTGFMGFISRNLIIISMIFLILILLSILCVLLIWMRRNQQFIQETEEMRLIKNQEKQLLKEKQFEALFQLIPQFEYDETIPLFDSLIKSQPDPPSCSICLCDFEKQDSVRVTYCPHFFHSDCLKQWLLKQKNCPHCRNDLSQIALSKNELQLNKFLAKPSIAKMHSATKNDHKRTQSQSSSPRKSKQSLESERTQKPQISAIQSSIKIQSDSNLQGNYQLLSKEKVSIQNDDNENILNYDAVKPSKMQKNISISARKQDDYQFDNLVQAELTQKTSVVEEIRNGINGNLAEKGIHTEPAEGGDTPGQRRHQSTKNIDAITPFNMRVGQILEGDFKSFANRRLSRLQSNFSNDGQQQDEETLGTLGDMSFKASSQKKLQLPPELSQIQPSLGKSIFASSNQNPNNSSSL